MEAEALLRQGVYVIINTVCDRILMTVNFNSVATLLRHKTGGGGGKSRLLGFKILIFHAAETIKMWLWENGKWVVTRRNKFAFVMRKPCMSSSSLRQMAGTLGEVRANSSTFYCRLQRTSSALKLFVVSEDNPGRTSSCQSKRTFAPQVEPSSCPSFRSTRASSISKMEVIKNLCQRTSEGSRKSIFFMYHNATLIR